MIVLRDCVKILKTRKTRTVVLDGVDLVVPSTGVTVILGHQASGKTTLARILSGSERPTEGTVLRSGSVSFPLGTMGFFHPRQKARQVVLHIAEVYGVDTRSILGLLTRLPGFDRILDEEMVELPGPLRQSLAYAVGYAMPFDMYVFDGFIAVGPPRFRAFCEQFFAERRRTAGMVLATSSQTLARNLADRIVILHGGQLTEIRDKEAALARFAALAPTRDDIDQSS